VERALHMLDELRDIVQGSPGLRLPRSRAVILKARRWAVARRLSSPRRSVSSTISRNGSVLGDTNDGLGVVFLVKRGPCPGDVLHVTVRPLAERLDSLPQ
jgi:hypothetical protein